MKSTSARKDASQSPINQLHQIAGDSPNVPLPNTPTNTSTGTAGGYSVAPSTGTAGGSSVAPSTGTVSGSGAKPTTPAATTGGTVSTGGD
jgi:hypothetical protein